MAQEEATMGHGVMTRGLLLVGMSAALGAGPGLGAPPPAPDAQAQVRAREQAFAKTMADRDHAAFVSFLADETVFFGPTGPLRGKRAVADAWKAFYDGPAAPFSWEPDTAEVLDSGALAMTAGPVFDPTGKRVGTFNSTWRREADGQWRVVFDKGCPPCECR